MLITSTKQLEDLSAIKMPKPTKTYQPIGHVELLNFVAEKLDKKSLKIETASFTTNKDGNQLFATLGVGVNNTDFRMGLGFRNSYDKSLPVGFVSGAQVIVCSNMMFKGEEVVSRRHTKGVSKDLEGVFSIVLDNIEEKFEQILVEADFMKSTPLSKEKAQQLYGEILMERSDMAPTNQVLKAIDLFKNPIHGFGNDTVWGFYNTFTESFKDSHPVRATKQYLELHDFIANVN